MDLIPPPIIPILISLGGLEWLKEVILRLSFNVIEEKEKKNYVSLDKLDIKRISEIDINYYV